MTPPCTPGRPGVRTPESATADSLEVVNGEADVVGYKREVLVEALDRHWHR